MKLGALYKPGSDAIISRHDRHYRLAKSGHGPMFYDINAGHIFPRLLLCIFYTAARIATRGNTFVSI